MCCKITSKVKIIFSSFFYTPLLHSTGKFRAAQLKKNTKNLNLTYEANSVASIYGTFFRLKITVESTSNFCHPFAKVAETYYYLVDSFSNQRVMWMHSALTFQKMQFRKAALIA